MKVATSSSSEFKEKTDITKREIDQIFTSNHNEMHKIMTAKLWMAEPSTIELSYLINDMMACEKILDAGLPADSETVNAYFNPEGLDPLYKDISQTYQRLSAHMKPPPHKWLAWIKSKPKQTG